MSMVVWVNLAAIGFLVLLALTVLKFAISGAITKRHIWEATRVVICLVCLALVGLWSRGNIGPWAVGALATLAAARSVLAFFKNRAATPTKRQ
jgi:hypothetical protein